ncbi:MAG TPA: hypothetical protein VF519_13790 [Mycobacteriales bacterium]
MRRPLLGLLLAAAAASFVPAASANPYCEPYVGPVRGTGPVCTTWCLLSLHPSVDPDRLPPLSGTSASCMWED